MKIQPYKHLLLTHQPIVLFQLLIYGTNQSEASHYAFRRRSGRILDSDRSDLADAIAQVNHWDAQAYSPAV